MFTISNSPEFLNTSDREKFYSWREMWDNKNKNILDLRFQFNRSMIEHKNLCIEKVVQVILMQTHHCLPKFTELTKNRIWTRNKL